MPRSQDMAAKDSHSFEVWTCSFVCSMYHSAARTMKLLLAMSSVSTHGLLSVYFISCCITDTTHVLLHRTACCSGSCWRRRAKVFSLLQDISPQKRFVINRKLGHGRKYVPGNEDLLPLAHCAPRRHLHNRPSHQAHPWPPQATTSSLDNTARTSDRVVRLPSSAQSQLRLLVSVWTNECQLHGQCRFCNICSTHHLRFLAEAAPALSGTHQTIRTAARRFIVIRWWWPTGIDICSQEADGLMVGVLLLRHDWTTLQVNNMLHPISVRAINRSAAVLDAFYAVADLLSLCRLHPAALIWLCIVWVPRLMCTTSRVRSSSSGRFRLRHSQQNRCLHRESKAD